MKQTCWEFDRVKEGASVALYTPKKLFNSLQFEILNDTEQIYGYLNILRGKFPPSPEIIYTIGDHSFKCSGIVMKGEQRLLLPKEVTITLLKTLQKGEDIKVSTGSYVVDISASGASTRGSTLNVI
ncbi:MAG: hypothetical protein S4CHLAM45_03120 [Chlamydiales bacterium]|nr:hypothetical protein [Chlamydiales bacterium]MCH9622432.1 hypothetical protein [Chlamydiales bacterium]